MESKKCGKCNEFKLITEFYCRKRGLRSGQYYEKCKVCMKIRGRWYYHENRDRQLPLAIGRRRKARIEKGEFINKMKDVPCIDCGKKFPPYVMDFHHRDKKGKIDAVGHMLASNWSLANIKNEIEKCDIVCSNCHRVRTFIQYAEVA